MRILSLFAIALAASPAAAAQRNYSVTDFTRIKVDGPYAVTLATDVSPFARASGSQAALDRVSLRVEGRTLIIRTDKSSWGSARDEDLGPVTIGVGTHEVEQATLSGPGSLAIDKVKGLNVALSSFGAGAVSVGALTADRLSILARGAGSMRIEGTAKQLNASLDGPGMIDASGLLARDATLSALGPASIRASVSNSVKLIASGTATIALDGGAACEKKVSGSAIVTGCR